jgi:hypothetical protein
MNLGGYEIIVRGDVNGSPVLDVVHDSNILSSYYPKNISELIDCINGITIN